MGNLLVHRNCTSKIIPTVPYTQLSFSILAALGIFSVMGNILQGIPGVVMYLDDILINGPVNREHLEFLETMHVTT